MWQNVIGPHETILNRPVWMNEIQKIFNFHNLNLYIPLHMAMCNWRYCSCK